MRLKFEHYDIVAKQVLAAIKKAAGELELPSDCPSISVEVYRMGHENGFKLTWDYGVWQQYRAVWFAGNRSRAHIVVYRCKDGNCLLPGPDALAFSQRAHFEITDIEKTARYILNFLLYGRIYYHRLLSVRHLRGGR